MKNTHWCVITGQPCSGKTTVINALRDKGYTVSEEVARKFYLQLLEEKSREELLKQRLFLQKVILDIELEREEKLDVDATIFFDRALPDSIAYYRNIGVVPDFVTNAAKRFKYHRVFFLDPLPFEQDGVREEDPVVAKRIGQYIYEAYSSLGYDVVRVPVLPVEQRVAFVLEQLG